VAPILEDYRRLDLLINEDWNCTFSCITCGANKMPHLFTLPEDLPLDYFREVYTEFYSFFDKYPRIITVKGGEPLYRWRRFIDTVKDIHEHCPEAITQTVSNCSALYDEANLRELEASGLSRLLCSLNSHIPEVHNYSRNSTFDNCSFIKGLPARTSIPLYANAILDEFNAEHFSEFVQEAKNLGFKGLLLSMNKGILLNGYQYSEFRDYTKGREMVSFLITLLNGKEKNRGFIANPDENIKDLIEIILNNSVAAERRCVAPQHMIICNQAKHLIYCCGGGYRLNPTLIPYVPGAIRDSFTEGTKLNTIRMNMHNHCGLTCRVSAAHYEPPSLLTE